MTVVEGVSNLVHDEVGVLEEAEHTIIKFNAHIIFILFKAEGTDEEVLHPVIIERFNEVILQLQSQLLMFQTR